MPFTSLEIFLNSEGSGIHKVANSKCDRTFRHLSPVIPRGDPDSDRAKKPPLAEPSATNQELNPGDRVGGLGDFGKPTGEFGTVEQANEDDAVVKWDDDGRMRLHQPSLKKV